MTYIKLHKSELTSDTSTLFLLLHHEPLALLLILHRDPLDALLPPVRHAGLLLLPLLGLILVLHLLFEVGNVTLQVLHHHLNYFCVDDYFSSETNLINLQ